MKELSEQSRKRAENRYSILRTLHLYGRRQRAALSRDLKIRKTSVTSITAQAIQQGILVEDEPKSLRTTVSLNPDKTCVAVARLGTREIESARVMLDGSVEGARVFTFAAGATSRQILSTAEKALRHQLNAKGNRVLGVGFADIGIVDPAGGVTKLASNLPQWRDVSVRSDLELGLKIGVHLDSDVRSQLFGSAWFDRHLRDTQTMLYIGLLEGVAGALMMNGKLVVGRHFSAGEFGHIRAGNEGRPCGCGKFDCLETYCSLPAITREVRRLRPRFDSRDVTGKSLFALAEEDAQIRKLLCDVSHRIVAVIAPILASLDPDALVLGSPSTSFGAMMGNLIHSELQQELSGLGASSVRLILAGADHASTLRGVGALVIDQCFQRGTPGLLPGAIRSEVKA